MEPVGVNPINPAPPTADNSVSISAIAAWTVVPETNPPAGAYPTFAAPVDRAKFETSDDTSAIAAWTVAEEIVPVGVKDIPEAVDGDSTDRSVNRVDPFLFVIFIE
jgi:hypothetical protein